MTSEQKPVAEFAEELSDAYSTPGYKGGWGPSIKMLRRRGLNDRNIEAIIRSKWTRWARDNARHDPATSKDLERWMDGISVGEIADLTRQHFGA